VSEIITQSQPNLAFDRSNFEAEELLHFYRQLLLPRLVEEKMLILLRQGKITKWFSGMGQEAVSIGAALAMQNEEFILPMHRNLGVFTSRKVPLHRLFGQFQGKPLGFSKGRDRSFHFGTKEHYIVGMISHLGAQLSLADGIALAHKLENENKVVLAFSGDGATSEGEFHEAMNVAAVWDLPVVFVIENNGYGLSTPNAEQYRCAFISDKAKGYGIKATKVEGNNVLEVYNAVRDARDYALKNHKPVLIEALTFRMRGHEEASGTKYVPKEVMEFWGTKDPVINFEAFLSELGILNETDKQQIRADFKKHIDNEWKKAEQAPKPQVNVNQELADVYAASSWELTSPNHIQTQNKRMKLELYLQINSRYTSIA